ncbi:hypothetical protein L486_05779 [Kwoniella mangroviensis CBS 10435]|uniref:Uncharacterized protein n=1 Tax=Kwoniella mangroviensis CBS 10435 TaxID=1331196 RepID=A0A1B9IMY7_9TREE|nr:hypothetical protein L486_05779 [Kwoniella mangroviensis CBS 10435]
MSTQLQVISSTHEAGGLKITFRSADDIEREKGSDERSVSNSMSNSSRRCSLHHNDFLPAFLDALPGPPSNKAQGHLAAPVDDRDSISAVARIAEEVKKD